MMQSGRAVLWEATVCHALKRPAEAPVGSAPNNILILPETAEELFACRCPARS